jgi:hypothetical protein
MTDIENENAALKEEIKELQDLLLRYAGADDDSTLYRAVHDIGIKFEQQPSKWLWINCVAEKLLETAPRNEFGRIDKCPACGNEASDHWAKREPGWAPEGLRMHLEHEGRAHPCEIITVAWRLYCSNHQQEWKAARLRTQVMALQEVKTICEANGCRCEIIEGTHLVWLQRIGCRRHHSMILSCGDHKFKISRPSLSYVVDVLASCSAQIAANALIWEHNNHGKRWVPDRDPK